MSGALIDTDVFSFILKRDSRAEMYREPLKARLQVLSFMTVAELERWALARRIGPKRYAELRSAIAGCVMLSPDFEMCRVFARVFVERERMGRPIETADCWNAAAALAHGLPLVTHNAKDYRDIPGLQVISHGS